LCANQDGRTLDLGELTDDRENRMRKRSLLLQGYRLTTAEILYHLPDHPGLLQSFVWQQLDLAPEFPALRRFLDFWACNLDGRLHSVRVAHAGALAHGRMRRAYASFALH
jgi:uncharacterized protein Usg